MSGPPGEDNRWYPLCREKDVAGTPVAVRFLGRPLVVFRTVDGISVLEDRCPHRNVPLSAGRLCPEGIECTYHGWRIDAAGCVAGVPGIAERTELHGVVDRVSAVRRYCTRSGHGLVWVCASNRGDDRLTASTLLDDPSLLREIWSFDVPATLANGAENLLDNAHTHYVHAGLIRSGSRRKAVRVRVRSLSSGVEAEYLDEGNQEGLISRFFEPERTINFGRFLLPGVAELEYRSGNTITLAITVYFTPLEAEGPTGCHRVHAVIGSPRSGLRFVLVRPIVRALFRRVLRQDVEILRRQHEALRAFGEECYLSTALDLLGPHLRRLIAAPQTCHDFPEYTVTLRI